MTTASKSAANSKKSTKPRGKPWAKGVSGNPAGAPKRGESWAEIIKRVGEYTPPEAAARSLELAKQLLKIGGGVTLKEAAIIRIFGAVLFEPQPGLVNILIERAEGKVKEQVELTGKDGGPLEVRAFNYAAAIAPITDGPEPDTETPGEDQSGEHGAALGEDADGG